MPALSISIDDTPLATVSTDGYDVVSVRVSGSRIDDNLADLDVTGGTHSEDGESTYLIWVDSAAVQPGQIIAVSFLEHAITSHPGKTIDELFPDKEQPEITDFRPTPEMFTEFRARLTVRDGFSFRFQSSSGTAFDGQTTDHGFAFTVLWDSFHPERARLSLHSYTLESLEQRGPMNYHVKENIQAGGAVSFEVA
jgi:hypothetical protein